MVATTQELFWKKEVKKENVPKIQVKSLKTPLKELISWSSSTISLQLTKKTSPPGILHNLALHLHILKIQEHQFFRKPRNGLLFKKKKKIVN